MEIKNWPTDFRPTAGQILKGCQDHSDTEKARGRDPKVNLNDFIGGINFGIQWLKSKLQEPAEGQYTKLLSRAKRLKGRLSAYKEYTGLDIISMIDDLINPPTK